MKVELNSGTRRFATRCKAQKIHNLEDRRLSGATPSGGAFSFCLGRQMLYVQHGHSGRRLENHLSLQVTRTAPHVNRLSPSTKPAKSWEQLPPSKCLQPPQDKLIHGSCAIYFCRTGPRMTPDCQTVWKWGMPYGHLDAAYLIQGTLKHSSLGKQVEEGIATFCLARICTKNLPVFHSLFSGSLVCQAGPMTNFALGPCLLC